MNGIVITLILCITLLGLEALEIFKKPKPTTRPSHCGSCAWREPCHNNPTHCSKDRMFELKLDGTGNCPEYISDIDFDRRANELYRAKIK